MGIQDWSEDIILVDLPAELQAGDELETVTQIVRDRGDCEVIVDFSSVDIVTSSSLSKLLKLRKLLTDCGHQLVFCNAAPATKKIFTITGLGEIFEFVDDKFTALAGLQMANVLSVRMERQLVFGRAFFSNPSLLGAEPQGKIAVLDIFKP